MKKNVTIHELRQMKGRGDIPGLLTLMDAKRVCEIGVKEGGNFGNLLAPCVHEAVAIDIWKEGGLRSENDDSCSQPQLDGQLAGMLAWQERDRRIRVIRNYSLMACKGFLDAYFDFVYIDADHTETAVYADLNAWYPKVRPGGVLAGHDYVAHTLPCGVKFGVIEALTRFTAEMSLELHVDGELPWHDWFIPVPA